LEGNPDITSALARVNNGAPIIALTHNPDIFPSIPARVALTIAGHTHGGQVAFPIIGRLIVPSDYGQRYAIGHIVEGSKHLFVTSGVGTSIFPVRFRVPPEISLLTID
jgi:predicted MPP superfamily phosphohydrolase